MNPAIWGREILTRLSSGSRLRSFSLVCDRMTALGYRGVSHMTDPRLNSCHLTLVRRWLYRGVREQLLYARGPLTCAAENDPEEAPWPIMPRGNDAGTNYVLVRSRDGRRYPLRTGLN